MPSTSGDPEWCETHQRDCLRHLCPGCIQEVLKPLVDIANAYDANNLDAEARKLWGMKLEKVNTTPPERIELYTGRGGNRLLTLADCLKAREFVRKM
jgi:hypothetical protein